MKVGKLRSMKVAKLWDQLSTFFATPYFGITSEMIIFDHYALNHKRLKLKSVYLCTIKKTILLESIINIKLCKYTKLYYNNQYKHLHPEKNEVVFWFLREDNSEQFMEHKKN